MDHERAEEFLVDTLALLLSRQARASIWDVHFVLTLLRRFPRLLDKKISLSSSSSSLSATSRRVGKMKKNPLTLLARAHGSTVQHIEDIWELCPNEVDFDTFVQPLAMAGCTPTAALALLQHEVSIVGCGCSDWDVRIKTPRTRLTLENVAAIACVFPQATSLACEAAYEFAEVFSALTRGMLVKAKNLKRLRLDVPDHFIQHNFEARLSLRLLLTNHSSLDEIHLAPAVGSSLDETLKVLQEACESRWSRVDRLTLEGLHSNACATLFTLLSSSYCPRRVHVKDPLPRCCRCRPTEIEIHPDAARLQELEIAGDSRMFVQGVLHLLAWIPSLRRLTILPRVTNYYPRPRAVTEEIVGLLRAAPLLEHLRLGFYACPVDLTQLYPLLADNQVLRELEIAVMRNIQSFQAEAKQFESMIDLLATQNDTLEVCTIHGNRKYKFALRPHRDRIEFYSKLNAMGRKWMRDPSTPKEQVVAKLIRACEECLEEENQVAFQPATSCLALSVLYGLLRENPAIVGLHCL